MKNLIKFIIFVFVTLICTGCVHQNSGDGEPYHRNVVDYDKRIGAVGCYDIMVYKFKYQGHTYIMFSQSKFENGVVHDPDCPCRNK